MHSYRGLDCWRPRLSMEVIGVTSGRPPSVNRLEGSTGVFAAFDGLRDAKVRDRDTLKIALQGPSRCGCGVCLAKWLTDQENAGG
jgi:hypothetical protein